MDIQQKENNDLIDTKKCKSNQTNYLKDKFKYYFSTIGKDYFGIFIIDFNLEMIDALTVSEPVLPMLSFEMSESRPYEVFFDFYCQQYISEVDREILKTMISPKPLKKKLDISGVVTL